VAVGPGSRALARLAESEIGETAQRQLMPTRLQGPRSTARYGHRLFTANDRESTGIVEFMPEL
jgi:hypothetical protein